MKLIHPIITAVSLWAAAPALAEDSRRGVDVKSTVRQALEERATPPGRPPRLPDATTEQPRKTRASTEVGQKEAAARAAQELADKQAEAHARRAQVDATQPGEQPAADEARKGNVESRAAAARDRTSDVRSNPPHGGPGQGPGPGLPDIHSMHQHH